MCLHIHAKKHGVLLFYQKQGTAANKFLQTMPVNDARKAVGMFKDEYLLDYINIEEMEVDKPEDIDERVIEKAIVRNIKKIIMTFGRDFAYIGNQYHLEMKPLDSNEIWQLRDVCIFEVNGIEVYM